MTAVSPTARGFGEDVAMPKWLRPYVVREVTDEEEYQNVKLAR